MEEQKTSETVSKPPQNNFLLRVALVVGVLTLAGVFGYTRLSSNISEPAKEPIVVSFVPAATEGSGKYPNGTYTTTGEYAPHGMPTEIEVKIQLEDDRIAASDVVLLSDDKISMRITQKFQDGYKEFVIGKPIEGLELGSISGSSLTSIGFNEALRKIESHAATL